MLSPTHMQAMHGYIPKEDTDPIALFSSVSSSTRFPALLSSITPSKPQRNMAAPRWMQIPQSYSQQSTRSYSPYRILHAHHHRRRRRQCRDVAVAQSPVHRSRSPHTTCSSPFAAAAHCSHPHRHRATGAYASYLSKTAASSSRHHCHAALDYPFCSTGAAADDTADCLRDPQVSSRDLATAVAHRC